MLAFSMTSACCVLSFIILNSYNIECFKHFKVTFVPSVFSSLLNKAYLYYRCHGKEKNIFHGWV